MASAQSRPSPERAARRPRATLVVGIGNPYRQDDGVGPAVIEKLGQMPLNDVDLCAHSGEGIDLMELWAGYQRVIVIDATSSGAEPGTVYRFEAHHHPMPPALFRYSTHQFGLAEAVELARTLGTLPDELIIYGIEGQRFGHGQGLSPRVEAAVVEVVRRIVTDLQGEG